MQANWQVNWPANWRVLVAGLGLAAVAVWLFWGLFSGGLLRTAPSVGGAVGVRSAAAPEVPPGAPFVTGVMPGMQSPQAMTAVGVAPPIDETGGVPNFMPPGIQLTEAHWQGLEAMPLTRELRRILRLPRGLKGALVDEVTLNAARSGMRGGDVIVMVGASRVTTLEELLRQSRVYRNMSEAPITILRKDKFLNDGRYSMKAMTFMLRASPDLGFAQVESAPMILPGAGRPHPYRGACTDCHTIGTGLEVTPDPELITLPPPPISNATDSREFRPHRDRGPCVACHIIK
jgi:hypothetical protein